MFAIIVALFVNVTGLKLASIAFFEYLFGVVTSDFFAS